MIRYKEDGIGFPLVFHRVDGREEQEAHSPSWFNKHEVVQVLDYVEKLLFNSIIPIRPSEIGIISPYLLQVRALHCSLRTNSASPKFTLCCHKNDILGVKSIWY